MVSPGLGGSAWLTDGAAQATTSAPSPTSVTVNAIAEPLDIGCTRAVLLLEPQRFRTLYQSRAESTRSNAVLVAARKKVTDPKCKT